MTNKNGLSIMVDSSAYSLWRLGGRLDIGEYAEFLENNRGLYD